MNPPTSEALINSATVNPNDKVDIHLLQGSTLDPRQADGRSLGTNAGWARADPSAGSTLRRSSRFVLLDKARSDDDMIDTMAHDLQGRRVVYTFQWELKPMTGTPPLP